MIKRKTRKILKQRQTTYKGKSHVKKILGENAIGFHNLKSGQRWSFTKLRQGASPATITDENISFDLPTMFQICYPGQTIRINTGWKAEQIPKDNAMQTYPGASLLNSDIVGVTQMYGQQFTGNQLTTILLNSGTQPLVFQVDVSAGTRSVYRINSEGEICQDLSDVNWGQFAKSALTIASHILPIFL